LESRYLDDDELRASMDSSTRTSSRPENAKPLPRKEASTNSGRNGKSPRKSPQAPAGTDREISKWQQPTTEPTR
jgi:hypothetical protein